MKPTLSFRPQLELPIDIITSKVGCGEIPTYEEFEAFLGNVESVLKSSYLALTLLFNVPMREGDKSSFLHAHSVAMKPDYRFGAGRFASGFKSTSFQKSEGYIHDLREDFGKNIAGSYVVGEIVEALLGRELATGLEYLTNNNDFFIKPIRKKLRLMDRQRRRFLELGYFKEKLKTELSRFKELERKGKLYIDESTLKDVHYKRVIGALEGFVNDVEKYHHELSPKERKFLTDYVQDNFIAPLSLKVEKREIIDPEKLTEDIKKDLEHLVDIVDATEGFSWEELEEIRMNKNPKYHSSESPNLVELENKSYRDFVEGIVNKSYSLAKEGNAKSHELYNNPSTVPTIKICDSISTVAILEGDEKHAIRQFRKAKIIMEIMGRYIKKLEKDHSVGPEVPQKTEKAIRYLNQNLMTSLTGNPTDTMYEEKERLFSRMLSDVVKLPNYSFRNPIS